MAVEAAAGTVTRGRCSRLARPFLRPHRICNVTLDAVPPAIRDNEHSLYGPADSRSWTVYRM
jgi:hypothetical protein